LVLVDGENVDPHRRLFGGVAQEFEHDVEQLGEGAFPAAGKAKNGGSAGLLRDREHQNFHVVGERRVKIKIK